LRQRGDVREHHLADRARGQLRAQAYRQRLVVVVLADEHHTPGTVACLDHRAVVRQSGKGRLLDQHMLPGGEGLQCQVEVKSRRHGDDDRLDARIVYRSGVVRVAARSTVFRTVRIRLRAVAAGVRWRDETAQPPDVPAVHTCDEATSQEGNVDGFASR
jgi:hypothetical protein